MSQQTWPYALTFGILGTVAFLVFFICLFRCYRRRYPNGMDHGMPQVTVVHHQQRGQNMQNDQGMNMYGGSGGNPDYNPQINYGVPPPHQYNPGLYNPQVPAQGQPYLGQGGTYNKKSEDALYG